jgi:WD40 repeat protein
MQKKISTALLAALLLMLLAACSSIPITPADDSAQPNPPALLPHKLYYLSDEGSGVFQVWLIEPDGSTTKPVTNETNDVVEFDVSPTDGSVAYITNNQLYLVNPEGTERTLLVDGGQVDDQNHEYHYTQKISGVRWSPTGGLFAYGQNGIHLYFIDEQRDFHLIENEIVEREGGNIFPVALYSPVSWSPDANYLLLDIGFYEGGSLGTYNIETTELIRLGGEGIVCCHPTWTPDSQSVLVASPIIGLIASGLWRYDAQSGAEVELIHHTSEEDTLNFAGWPLQLPDGELRYFFNNMAAFPESGVQMLMVNAGADGVTGREPIRAEYWENFEVLWAEDGNLAVAVQPATGVQPSWPRTGPIVVIPASTEPVIPLNAHGYSLRWGP